MAAPTITPSRAARHAKPKPASQEPPPRSRLRRILRWALWLAVPVMAICAGTVIGLIYAFARVPLPDEIPTAQTIVFLDQTGRREIGTLTAQENRRVVPLDKIPVPMRQAVLAAEDRDFYDHGAISWRGLARATAANLLRRRISEGGSTITQQYVKNAFPGVGRDRTLFRKLKARRDYILQVMVDRGWLQAKQGRAAIASKLGVNWTPKRGGIVNSQAPHFLEKVRQYLVDKYGAEAVNMGGFRVRTTLDM